MRPGPVEQDGVHRESDVAVLAGVGHGGLVLVLRHRHRNVVVIFVPQVVRDRQSKVGVRLD